MGDELLSQDEVNALLSNMDPTKQEKPLGGIAGEEAVIRVYNFKRPDRVSKEQLRSLELMHEAFSRNLAVSLSGFMRTLAEVTLVSVDQLMFNEFTASLPSPTCFSIFSIAPLEGNIVIEVSPSISFPIVDRLLGGTGGSIAQVREMSDIELQIMEWFLNRVTGNLRETWRDLVDINFRIQGKETNPQVAQIVSPAETVVAMAFEIKIPGANGLMNICIPFVSIENLADKLTLQYRFSSAKKIRDFSQDKMNELMMKVPLPMIASLGKVQVTVRELLELKEGDIIPLQKSIHDDVEVNVANRRKFEGKLGLRNRRKAIQIKRAKKAE